MHIPHVWSGAEGRVAQAVVAHEDAHAWGWQTHPASSARLLS